MTRFQCPACERTAFIAGAPLWSYEAQPPRWWGQAQGPRKVWLGDLVRCANPACGLTGIAGTSGVVRLEPKAPTPAPEPPNGEPEKPMRREVSAIGDRDMRWFRD